MSAITRPMSARPSALASTTTRQHTALYYLLESGIDAATSTTLAVTFGGGTVRVNDVWSSVYDYVDQTTPITNLKSALYDISARSAARQASQNASKEKLDAARIERSKQRKSIAGGEGSKLAGLASFASTTGRQTREA